MEHEKYVVASQSLSVTVTDNAVSSVRDSEDLKTVVRAYDGGKVAVAGAVGDCNGYALLDKAAQKLSKGIPYPYVPTPARQRSERGAGPVIDRAGFVPACKSLVERLARSHPGFTFSNKINVQSRLYSYSSGSGAALNYRASNLTLALGIKAKNSANIMDLMYCAEQSEYSEDAIAADVGALLNVYGNALDVPRDVPVLLPDEVIGMIAPHLMAEKYMSGAGIFRGSLSRQLFDRRVTVAVDRRPSNKACRPFFDCEGTTLHGDRFPLISGGVFSGLITDKRSAQKYSLPLSGSAGADYDAVPHAGCEGVAIDVTHNSLKELIGGRAIYIALTSGGDMTSSGDVNLPVLLAYVYEDGRLSGVLPQFSVSVNIFDMLGNDFVGVAKNDALPYSDQTLIAARCRINL